MSHGRDAMPQASRFVGAESVAWSTAVGSLSEMRVRGRRAKSSAAPFRPTCSRRCRSGTSSVHDDLGDRLRSLVDELQDAVAVVRVVPQVALQGGLRGKADLVLRLVVADRAGRDVKLTKIVVALPEVGACILGSAVGQAPRARAPQEPRGECVGG